MNNGKNGSTAGRAPAKPRKRAEKQQQHQPGLQPQPANAVRLRKQVHLITGATSGIGVLLTRRLIARGDMVRVLLEHNPNASDEWKRVPPGAIPYVADITLVHQDDRKVLEDACRGVDTVFHFASLVDYQSATFDDFVNVNVIGTENVLNACIEANAGGAPFRFFYMSSTRVYGTKRPGEILTENSELKPTDSYGETKLMGEQVVKSFAEAHTRVRYTIFRAATLYGPHYDRSSFRLFKMVKEQRMRYIGDGSNHQIMVHVEDVADAFIAALDNPVSVNRIYNITDGKSYTLKEVVDRIAGLLGVPKPVGSVNPALAKIAVKLGGIGQMEADHLMSDRVVSIDKIRSQLGFSPKRNIDTEAESTLEEFNRYYRK